MQTKGFLSERSTATKNRTKEKKHKECLVEITAVRYTSGDESVVLVVAVINYPPNHDLRWLISGCRYHIFGGWNTTLHIGQSSEGDMKGRWESTLTLRTVKDKCKLPLKPFWNKIIIKQNPNNVFQGQPAIALLKNISVVVFLKAARYALIRPITN